MLRQFLLICFAVSSVLSLRTEDGEEGDCQGLSWEPVEIEHLTFLDKLIYISSASRFNYYLLASGQPGFPEMTESELEDNMCLTHNIRASNPESHGSAFGFGGIIANITVRQTGDKLGVFEVIQEVDPANPDAPVVRKIQVVTLTDFNTYAFTTECCQVKSEHRTWSLYSLTPELDDSVKIKIEEFAASLQFRRQHFVHLDYSRCEKGHTVKPPNKPYYN